MSDSPASIIATRINQSSQPAVEPQTAKPQTETETPSSQNVDKFASKFAALTRKERELAGKATEWESKQKAKEEEYSRKMAEIAEKQSKFAPYEGLDAEIKGGNKKKALEFLFSQGLSAEELSDLLVQEMNPDPELRMKKTIDSTTSALKKEIEDLENQLKADKEAEIEAARAKEEERAKLQHDEVVNKVLNQLTSFVNGNENDYTLIKQYNSVDLVYETMQAHYDEQLKAGVPENDVKLLSYKDACDNVESYLADEVKKTYEAKWSKQAPKKEVNEPKSAQTLTNTLSSEVPKSGERYMSDEESKRAAAKMLRWME